jgi:hypothetical protein
LEYRGFLPHLQKKIAGKDRLCSQHHHPLAADRKFPLRKINVYRTVRMQGPEKTDILFFSTGFYLKGIIVHCRMLPH